MILLLPGIKKSYVKGYYRTWNGKREWVSGHQRRDLSANPEYAPLRREWAALSVKARDHGGLTDDERSRLQSLEVTLNDIQQGILPGRESPRRGPGSGHVPSKLNSQFRRAMVDDREQSRAGELRPSEQIGRKYARGFVQKSWQPGSHPRAPAGGMGNYDGGQFMPRVGTAPQAPDAPAPQTVEGARIAGTASQKASYRYFRRFKRHFLRVAKRHGATVMGEVGDHAEKMGLALAIFPGSRPGTQATVSIHNDGFFTSSDNATSPRLAAFMAESSIQTGLQQFKRYKSRAKHYFEQAGALTAIANMKASGLMKAHIKGLNRPANGKQHSAQQH